MRRVGGEGTASRDRMFAPNTDWLTLSRDRKSKSTLAISRVAGYGRSILKAICNERTCKAATWLQQEREKKTA